MCDNWEFALEPRDRRLHHLYRRRRRRHARCAHPAEGIAFAPSGVRLQVADSHLHLADGRLAAQVSHVASEGQRCPWTSGAAARLMMRMGGWKHYDIPCMYHSAVAREIPDPIRGERGASSTRLSPTCSSPRRFRRSRLGDADGLRRDLARPFAKVARRLGLCRQGSRVQDQFVSEYGDYRIHPTLYPGVTLKANLIADAVLVARDLFPEFYGEWISTTMLCGRTCCVCSGSSSGTFRRARCWPSGSEIRAYHPFHPGTFPGVRRDARSFERPPRRSRWDWRRISALARHAR